MLRTIIRLSLVALVVHASVRIAPVFWTHFKFRDAVEDMAMFSQKQTEREVIDRIMGIAERMDVPLDRANVEVRRTRGITHVDARYVAQLEYFPKRFYPWAFELDLEAVPPRYSNVIQ
jgi:hypothetical protein